MKKETNNYAYITIVAIVAIVAVVALTMNTGSVKVDNDDNLAGQGSATALVNKAGPPQGDALECTSGDQCTPCPSSCIEGCYCSNTGACMCDMGSLVKPLSEV